MLKYIKDAMASTGIEIYPIISLLIFIIFFTILIVYTLRMSKKHIQHLKDIPLQDEDEMDSIYRQ